MVTCGCGRWTIKKAQRQRTDTFELWCWRRFSRVPWTAGRSNQSVLKEISPECSLDAEAETSATWCEELTHLKRHWCWERLKAGREGNDRIWDGWMTIPIQRTWVWVHSRSWWWTRRPGVLWFMGSQRAGHHWVTELTDWSSAATIKLFTVKESQCLMYIQTKNTWNQKY